MAKSNNPNRTPIVRVLTIASSGMGSFLLAIWGFRAVITSSSGGLSPAAMVAIISGLCALAAAGAAAAFFAGVDESNDFIYSETHFDKLTGFLARGGMIGEVAKAAENTLNTGEPVFMLDIDIDRFKHINDAIGYTQGDELIRLFAGRLKELTPAGTIIGRIGAGEFAVLISEKTTDLPLDQYAEQLIARLMEPYKLRSHLQTVNLSAGIVAMPKDGRDPILLMRRSNLALQHARASGIGNWSVFHPEMGEEAEYRQWVESELATAFERGDFDLFYQPQLNLLSGEIVGYEALIRWRHPDRGMIPPLEFIPVAEETGMINQIGEWVLRKACHDALLLPANAVVAVNISAVQFMSQDIVGLVKSALADAGIPATRLEIEITESVMVGDKGKAARVLKELSALGVTVAVDDFGTGYSNLAYLIDFSFQKLKIDRSFVSRIDQDSSTGAVVSTIVGLSRALGVHTIAEGVETENQAIMLKAAGCDVVQGFFYGRPEPLVIRDGKARALRAA